MKSKRLVVLATAAAVLSSTFAPMAVMAEETENVTETEGMADVSTEASSDETDAVRSVSIGSSAYNVTDGWYYADGKQYWLENGTIQGTVNDPKGVWYDGSNRGREIYDSGTDAWYWLDSVLGGAKAVSKQVFMPYIYANDHGANGGKWVRYDATGRMIYGWYPSSSDKQYYYEYPTGQMVHGKQTIDGVNYYFDNTTGVLKKGWFQSDGNTFYSDSKTGELAIGRKQINGQWYSFNTQTGAMFQEHKAVIGEDVWSGVDSAGNALVLEYRGYQWNDDGDFDILLKVKNNRYHAVDLTCSSFSINSISARIAFSYEIAARTWTDSNKGEYLKIHVPASTIENRKLNANGGVQYADFSLDIYDDVNSNTKTGSTGNIHILF